MEKIIKKVQEAGLATPTYRRGWQYLGQGFLEWHVPGDHEKCYLQVELLYLKYGTETITARIFAHNPFGTEPTAAYRLKVITDVLNHLDELLEVIETFFPLTKNGLKFCLTLSGMIHHLCEEEAKSGKFSLELPLKESIYKEQIKFLKDGLDGVGLSQVTLNENLLTISWSRPETAIEQELKDLVPS